MISNSRYSFLIYFKYYYMFRNYLAFAVKARYQLEEY